MKIGFYVIPLLYILELQLSRSNGTGPDPDNELIMIIG